MGSKYGKNLHLFFSAHYMKNYKTKELRVRKHQVGFPSHFIWYPTLSLLKISRVTMFYTSAEINFSPSDTLICWKTKSLPEAHNTALCNIWVTRRSFAFFPTKFFSKPSLVLVPSNCHNKTTWRGKKNNTVIVICLSNVFALLFLQSWKIVNISLFPS